jgi:hypothetical protein
MVSSVAFSRGGRRIVTGSEDWTAKVWTAARPEEIASWRAEELAAEESVAAGVRARGELARKEGFLQDWLVLAPIVLARGEDGVTGLKQQQLAQEAKLRPRAGQAVRLSGKNLVWKKYHLDDYFLDFNVLVQQRAQFSVAYAVCYLVSDTERKGLQLKVGSDDQAKIYLNGAEIYRFAGAGRAMQRDQDTVRDLTLRKGTNILVFKVVNETIDWKGCVRFLDKDGKPVTGIRVRLEPDR